MEWWLTLSIALSVLFLLLFIGVPVFVSFLVINVIGVFALFGSRGFGLFANSILETATSPSLITIPLFVLMGELLFHSGTVDVLFQSVDKLIGRVKGRLYVLVVALSTVFGALSGSAVAVAAMLGRSVLPRMIAHGYDEKLSVSTILGGASLAPIIPPSLLVVIVGSLVKDVSISGLLVAGILPGLLLAGLLLAFVAWRVFRTPGLVPPQEDEAPASLLEKFWALIKMAPFGIIIFMVMGLIMLGVATPSEAAATGVLGALMTAAFYRRLNFQMIWRATVSAVGISAMILVIIASSKLFSQLLSFTGATGGMIEAVTAVDLPHWLMFVALMAVPFFLCMFIDQFAFMLLAIPLYEPILAVYGYEPIWFWMIFLINLTVGSLTPPFGYTLFAMKGASDGMSMQTVFGSAWPIVGIFIAGMTILAFAPGIVTWLPSQF